MRHRIFDTLQRCLILYCVGPTAVLIRMLIIGLMLAVFVQQMYFAGVIPDHILMYTIPLQNMELRTAAARYGAINCASVLCVFANTLFSSLYSVYWLPTGGPAAQAKGRRPPVGRRFFIHRVNQVNSRNGSAMMTAV